METLKIVLDVETAPSLGHVWGKWEQNVLDFERDWYILSYAYKILGDKKIIVRGLNDFKNYKKDPENDECLVNELWMILDEADVIIAHNGDRFDIPKINTRFLFHKLNPPSPFKTVDTLKILRSVFKLDSNKLDDACRYLGIGRKLPHTGFQLWKGCMSQDEPSWKLMKRYNAHDVELLEELYYKTRAWCKNHPSINQGIVENCPKCNSNKVQRRGFDYTLLRKKQRFSCNTCHGWFSGAAK